MLVRQQRARQSPLRLLRHRFTTRTKSSPAKRFPAATTDGAKENSSVKALLPKSSLPGGIFPRKS